MSLKIVYLVSFLINQSIWISILFLIIGTILHILNKKKSSHYSFVIGWIFLGLYWLSLPIGFIETGDYFNALDDLNKQEKGRKVLLFLGSTIGNFIYKDALRFLKELNQQMNQEDLLLIGFDLKKDPTIILNAYNDQKGITEAFNLNLLERINNELDGNFNLGDFYHYPTYNPNNGEAQSYLISKKEQKIAIKALDQTFHFEEGESIFMEISKKYDTETINKLAEEAGFEVKENFFDQKRYFTNSLWKKDDLQG